MFVELLYIQIPEHSYTVLDPSHEKLHATLEVGSEEIK
jgi:hypothetical protein